MNKIINCIKNTALILLLGMFIAFPAQSQVTIGSQISPQKGTLLDLKEYDEPTDGTTSTKGMIYPRVNLVEIDKLDPILTDDDDEYYTAGPSYTGLVVYNMDESGSFEKGLYVWDGAKWTALAATEWYLPEGTLDARGDKTSSIYRVGNVGIGTTSPSTLLDIESGTSGAVKIVDGNQGNGKALISDANGVATWQSPVPHARTGTIPNADKTLNIGSTGQNGEFHWTGYTITVPPGRSTISAGFLVITTSSSRTPEVGTEGYVTCLLSSDLTTNPQSSGASGSNFTCTPKLSGFPIPVVGTKKYTTGTTFWYVDNTSGGDLPLRVMMTGGGYLSKNFTVTLGGGPGPGYEGFLEPFIYAAY